MKPGAPWAENEKDIIEVCPSSKMAVELYFDAFPDSKRSKNSIYTYWAWKHNAWGKGSELKVKKEPAPITGPIEKGDKVQYAKGNFKSPIGLVISTEKRRGIPERSQKILVRFGGYNNRLVYATDYKIVEKGAK